MDCSSDDDTQMPTEAELAAKRALRDRISNRMGQLMLKGYTMLADSCPKCYVRAPCRGVRVFFYRYGLLTLWATHATTCARW